MESCAICGLKIADASDSLCTIHTESFRNVVDTYSRWSVAYGNITREDFLKRLVTRLETGFRAKEIAEFLIKNPERWK